MTERLTDDDLRQAREWVADQYHLANCAGSLEWMRRLINEVDALKTELRDSLASEIRTITVLGESGLKMTDSIGDAMRSAKVAVLREWIKKFNEYADHPDGVEPAARAAFRGMAVLMLGAVMDLEETP